MEDSKQSDKETDTYIFTCSIFYQLFHCTIPSLVNSNQKGNYGRLKQLDTDTNTDTLTFLHVHYSAGNTNPILGYFKQKRGLQKYGRLKVAKGGADEFIPISPPKTTHN